jgi:putative CocE/NonD family hydrolase
VRHLFLATAVIVAAAQAAAQPAPPTPEQLAQRTKTYADLESIATIEHKLMVPMRDGVHLSTDVYRPKGDGKYATIFVRTPYNFNWYDVQYGVPRDATAALDAVKRGYAYVVQNERGKFWSEGTWDILGPPRTDGYDAIQWITTQAWSNGKLGTLGCSSTAEWQMGVAALGAPGHAAMVPQGFGAGVGRVGPFYEQGNWYRGGAVQMLFIDWLYGEQTPGRPAFRPGMTSQQLEEESRYYDLAPHAPRVDWPEAFKHLPEQDIFKAIDGPPGIFADSVKGIATGGDMIQRTPNDSAWYRGGLYHDDMPFKVPSLWFMSWYDVSISPNLELFNHVRKTASPEIAKNQYAVIAPVGHCAYKRATDSTVVGERWLGDARYGYDSLVYSWFDHFLNGADNHLLDTLPHVRYYTMGLNKWQTSDTWPPKGAEPMTFYLNASGALSQKTAGADKPETFTYDPMNPVPSYGGNVCCQPGTLAGSYDQRKMETRPDILVYTTDAFTKPTELSGPISVNLYVSSDRKDTDFTVKLIDVYPDGRAYNLDETIQRVRYREGYDKKVWMEPGKVYKVALGPMNTSDFFDTGHKLRIEVSSSNFPRFDRNLNTGGNNYDETNPVVAHNVVHHSKQYPSSITVTVVSHSPVTAAVQ